MKKVNSPSTDNCIESSSSCVLWNGGKVDFLGIENEDSLNNLIWEIITKLKSIAGEDLSNFDIDSILDICNQTAPNEVTLISILNTIKTNQLCLKDYIDSLNEAINNLPDNSQVNIDLKCFKTLDNLGNIASVTRDQLDQIVINRLCNHEDRIDSLESKATSLQEQINEFDPTANVTEPSIITCIDSAPKATSLQVKSVATAICDLRSAVGTNQEISTALGNTPEDFDTEFGLLPNWIPANSRNSWADAFGNLLIVVDDLRKRLKYIEDNCCAASCDDIKLGFALKTNEDGDGIILQFTSGAGTSIPSGFTDIGSTLKVTDKNGNAATANITIANNAEIEILVTGLDGSGGYDIEISAKLSNGSLTCQKCLSRHYTSATLCQACLTENTSSIGTVTVVTRQVTTSTSTTVGHPIFN